MEPAADGESGLEVVKWRSALAASCMQTTTNKNYSPDTLSSIQHVICKNKYLWDLSIVSAILHSRHLWWSRGNIVLSLTAPQCNKDVSQHFSKKEKKMIPDHSELQPEQKKLDLHCEEPLDYKVNWLAALSVVISVSTVLQLCSFMFCCSAAMSVWLFVTLYTAVLQAALTSRFGCYLE